MNAMPNQSVEPTADSAFSWCFAEQNSCGIASPVVKTCASRIAVPLEFLIRVSHNPAVPHAKC